MQRAAAAGTDRLDIERRCFARQVGGQFDGTFGVTLRALGNRLNRRRNRFSKLCELRFNRGARFLLLGTPQRELIN